ncbi:MAG: DUF1972 domain-containing protein [Clostridiales bacterium]|nr:DUF1972 domain-containing protein [Clostridiales bacterium]
MILTDIVPKSNASCETRQHVFIVGSKGIPAHYGGFETFVENLTKLNVDTSIQYHVACIGNKVEQFTHNDALCYRFNVPKIGATKAVYYDLASLSFFTKYCEKNNIQHPIFYVLACRIGLFIPSLKRQIEMLGGKFFLNPDGHEWKRTKWSKLIREYWKLSEKFMVQNADLVICDSLAMEKYIKTEYAMYKPHTMYIAYGADVKKSTLSDNDTKFTNWLFVNDLKPKEYYLVVGRLVPENNFEIMLREFMLFNTKKSLVLITEARGRYLDKLESMLHFSKDLRIKFVGSVYDEQLLKKIREGAYAYIHGHEVGGTNPGLLEALASTGLNLLLDVPFNREVGEDAALYWCKAHGSLANLIRFAELLDKGEIDILWQKSNQRILDAYSWQMICNSYNHIFNSVFENFYLERIQ